MDPYQNSSDQPSADLAPNTAPGPNNATTSIGGTNTAAPNANAVSPMVGQLQNFGRNNDSMLMHVTPGEVAGLQGLAQAAGGSLTTNPTTGLPEAGFLDSILPTVLGFALAPFTGGLTAAALVGGGATIASGGDLEKGLMAGLGAFGGAGLAGGLGLGAGASAAGASAAGASAAGASAAGAGAAGTTAATDAAATAGASAAAPLGSTAQLASLNAPIIAPQIAAPASGLGLGAASSAAPGAMAANGLNLGANTAASAAGAPNILSPFGPAAQQFGNRFAQAASIPGVSPGVTTGAAAFGAAQPVMAAMQPEMPTYQDPNAKWNYQGPYKPQDRKVSFPGSTPTNGEYQYFQNSNPYPGFQSGTGYANGGGVAVQSTPAPQRFAPIEAHHIPALMQQMGAMPPAQGGAPPLALPRPNINSQAFMQNMQRAPLNPAAFAPPSAAPAAPPQGEKNYGFASMGAAPPSPPSSYDGWMSGLMGAWGGGPGGLGALGRYFSAGGDVAQGGLTLENGAFIVDARTVSELGNGSSSAGQELLAKYGGQPIHGPGDGVSDSVPASIAGVKPAAVARDEVKFSPQAVARIGGGDLNKGTKKLYDLMARAQKARQTASRGQDTGLQGIMQK